MAKQMTVVETALAMKAGKIGPDKVSPRMLKAINGLQLTMGGSAAPPGSPAVKHSSNRFIHYKTRQAHAS